MKNMEREKFENAWKDAFGKAEVSPSDRVWSNIELDLEKAKGGDLKRRLMFYQMVAAASVVFAMAIGGVGYYYSVNQEDSVGNTLAMESTGASEKYSSAQTEILTENKIERQDAGKEANPGEVKESGQSTVKENNAAPALQPQAKAPQSADGEAREIQRSVEKNPDSNFTLTAEAVSGMVATADNRDVLPELPHEIDDRNLAPFFTPEKIGLSLQPEIQEVDPVVHMLAELDQRERELQGEKKNKNKKEASYMGENLWTSVGFAAGSFNSMQGSTSSPATFSSSNAMSLAAPIVDQETKASGYSYTMGVNVGTRLSERWVIQGGVNYLTHLSEFTANNVVVSPTNSYQQQRFSPVSTNELIHADVDALSNRIVYSAPYNVNNSMRYLSIPMQAGYLVVNKTVGVQLNAGVATDLFLQNTIQADTDQLEKTSQPGGADSPYRSVNLSGLLGTELSYRFSENYRISLNPGIRYPLNTIYKSELGVQSTPLTFDVGLRFRYIFR